MYTLHSELWSTPHFKRWQNHNYLQLYTGRITTTAQLQKCGYSSMLSWWNMDPRSECAHMQIHYCNIRFIRYYNNINFVLEPYESILSYNYGNIFNHYTVKLSPGMNRDVITTAVVSSIVVFIFSSTLFFILGCVCGWVGHKYKTKWSDKNTHSHCQAAPLYEDLQPSMPMSVPGE